MSTFEIDLVQTGDVVFAIMVMLAVLLASFAALFLLERRWPLGEEDGRADEEKGS